jgi:hypothetical protein
LALRRAARGLNQPLVGRESEIIVAAKIDECATVQIDPHRLRPVPHGKMAAQSRTL